MFNTFFFCSLEGKSQTATTILLHIPIYFWILKTSNIGVKKITLNLIHFIKGLQDDESQSYFQTSSTQVASMYTPLKGVPTIIEF